MRNITLWIIVSVLVLTAGLQAQTGNGPRRGNRGNGNCIVLPDLPMEDVSDNERQFLLSMREEEKLARDVYKALAGRWGLRGFSQIAASESKHMDAVKALLDKYGIPDPVGEDLPGVFSDGGLQELYARLIDEGSVSAAAALKVGATIEDLDIADLLKAIAGSDSRDILTVFQNLAKGSRNHLRSFVSHLESLGLAYVPQYITQELFDSIVASDPERGPVDAAGQFNGQGNWWNWSE